jgi:hypothetical protein
MCGFNFFRQKLCFFEFIVPSVIIFLFFDVRSGSLKMCVLGNKMYEAKAVCLLEEDNNEVGKKK